MPHTQIPTYCVTGGAGFIGSCYVLQTLSHARIITIDKLTYSGNLENLKDCADNPQHIFIHGDIGNAELMRFVLQTYRPQAIINFAAESHVDRSILDPDAFVRTNVLGTSTLLHTALRYWQKLPETERNHFRFLHISTDEVFGSLHAHDPGFTEQSPYAPNSPYSASKAASDHLVRAFHETYGLPTLITNCSNNYGPRQFPEKLIPLMICNALAHKPLPVYGTGNNIRDWVHVEDHCEAVQRVLTQGRTGQTYNIGGRAEHSNLEIVHMLCTLLDEIQPRAQGTYADLITFVQDRPGHDFRYAIDCTRMETELGWKPRFSFAQGLRKTVRWYLDNRAWTDALM